MSDPVVSITNFLLTLECWIFAVRLARWPDRDAVSGWYGVLFWLLGLGALFGGISHGFLTDPDGLGARVVWMATLTCLGAASVATAMIAIEIAFPPKWLSRARWLVTLAFLAYLLIVLFASQDFLVAIAGSLPAVIVLMAALLWLFLRTGARGILLGLSGLILTLVGAVQQQMQIRIDPVWFDHNAVYHAIQFAAFLLIYLGVAPISRAARRGR